MEPYNGRLGHHGPITGAQYHPTFANLLLSCSVDWSAKLWSHQVGGAAAAAAACCTWCSGALVSRKGCCFLQGNTLTPLSSFEAADDYLFDARW